MVVVLLCPVSEIQTNGLWSELLVCEKSWCKVINCKFDPNSLGNVLRGVTCFLHACHWLWETWVNGIQVISAHRVSSHCFVTVFFKVWCSSAQRCNFFAPYVDCAALECWPVLWFFSLKIFFTWLFCSWLKVYYVVTQWITSVLFVVVDSLMVMLRCVIPGSWSRSSRHRPSWPIPFSARCVVGPDISLRTVRRGSEFKPLIFFS